MDVKLVRVEMVIALEVVMGTVIEIYIRAEMKMVVAMEMLIVLKVAIEVEMVV